jgi:hypothetical protein
MTQQKQTTQNSEDRTKLLLEKTNKFQEIDPHLRRGRAIHLSSRTSMRKTDKHLTSIEALEDKPQSRRGRPPGSHKQDQEQPGSVFINSINYFEWYGCSIYTKEK